MKKIKGLSFIIAILGLIVLSNFVNPVLAKFPEDNASQAILNIGETTNSAKIAETPILQNEFLMPTEEQLGPVIINDESGIPDSNFYQLLVGVFNEYYKTASNFVKQSQLRINMLANITEINLANMRITSVTGLSKLNLSNLQKLNLGANSISSIKTDELKYMSSLTELYLYENNISEITIPMALNNLNILNLNANKLSKIDISGINSGKVSLSFNKFTSINDITFPRKIVDTNLTVELFNNNIVDADEMYNKNGELENGGQITIELGIQGVGLNYKITDNEEDKVIPTVSRDQEIKFYNVNDEYNLEVVIKRVVDNQVEQIITNNEQNKISSIVLPVADYKLEYCDKTTHENKYNYYDATNCGFKEINSFNVIPKAPTVKFIVDGKEYADYGKFTSWNAKLVATNAEEEGEIYYSIAGGKWVKGSEVDLNRGGRYSVSFKVVINNLSSKSVTKQVYMSQNPYVPDVLMLVIIGVVIALVFFVVLPFIIKKINR